MRRVFFWSHLCAGLTAGAVILVMSVTGVLLTYERQITEWADGYQIAPLAPPTPASTPRPAARAQGHGLAALPPHR